jgi:hypothetical protein
MAYRQNWVRHLLAPLAGECWNKELARDFCWIDEDLWEATKSIKWRLLKLTWVYSVCVVTQITMPAILFIAVANLFFKKIPLQGWVAGVAVGSAIAFVYAVLHSIVTYLWLLKKSRSSA